MTQFVTLLLHFPDGEAYRMFILGVFDNPESVTAAVGRYRTRLGFKDHPTHFWTLEVPLDDSAWSGGRPLAELALGGSSRAIPVP